MAATPEEDDKLEKDLANAVKKRAEAAGTAAQGKAIKVESNNEKKDNKK